MQGVAWPVRWWYDTWQQLPQVRLGAFGRGVVALSEEGFQRVRRLPALLADDLAMSAAFTTGERKIIQEATVTVHPPRTWADLIRRRVRVVTGTTQAYGSQAFLPTDSRTNRGDILDLAMRKPHQLLKIGIFLAAAVSARRRAARMVAAGDFSTWLRDASSRTASPPR